MPQGPVYISITGLELKAQRHALRFWWHAIRSMMQARAAEGNLYAETKTIHGVHHTLSIWRDRKAMLAYLRSGAHRKALRVFPSIATGKVIGFETDNPPDWSEVHEIWKEQGREV